jgi:glyoxylase-like metal-dependent hydrolase (beta-lactamase superfamily II)
MLLALALAAALQVQAITASPEGFSVNSTLVSGDKDAVLIDADFTLPDAGKVVEAIKASGKNLTTIYVTHSHPDHYFGVVALHKAFPKAKIVALPAAVEEIKKTWAGKVKQWKPIYKDAITDKPLLPQPLQGNSLTLEGQKLEIQGGLQGDDKDNSYVWIPSIKTVITGDIVFDGVYPWTADSTPAERKDWIASLDKIAALNPDKVVPGHQKPERKQDPSNLQFTKEYLTFYDEAAASSKTPEELQQKVKEKFPGLALDVILKLGSEATLKKN